MCMFVCVCVCARARARVLVCVIKYPSPLVSLDQSSSVEHYLTLNPLAWNRW